jgi:transposase
LSPLPLGYEPGGRNIFCETDPIGGANASARLYSLIETARANGIEPHFYLAHLCTELPKATGAEHFEALLPWRIALAHTGIK